MLLLAQTTQSGSVTVLCTFAFGALMCFAGQRFFRSLLLAVGFVAGASVTGVGTSYVTGSTPVVAIVAVLGGFAGAILSLVLFMLYMLLLGALLGCMAAVAVSAMLQVQPPLIAYVLPAVGGAAFALVVREHIVVLGTAFAGSAGVVGAMLDMMGKPKPVEVVHDPALWGGDAFPVVLAWFIIGAVGGIVQYRLTAKRAETEPQPA
jgi:hypothetical protein